MSLVSCQTDVEMASARNLLDVLLERLERLEPVYREIGEIITNSVRRNFEESRSPEGKPWAPLKGRADRGRKPLMKTGRLASSIRERVGGESLSIEANAVYAAVHQFGGKAGRRGKAIIPARPFLGVRTEDWQAIESAILKHLLPSDV